MKRFFLFFSVMCLLIAAGFCTANIYVNFPPPISLDDNAALFPQSILGFGPIITPSVEPEGFQGKKAVYNSGRLLISIIKAPDEEKAVYYFETNYLTFFDKMSKSIRSKDSGNWVAKGIDNQGSIWYGWVNKNWVFILSALSEKDMDALVRAFAYAEMSI